MKNLLSYIKLFAISESSDMNLDKSILPVCIDADAGGGRFVASFTFLNRKDETVKLHPFLMFEGSDCRKNMEITLGEFTETISKLEGTKVEIDGKEYVTELYCLLDLCAINCLIGKQNHSSIFPCAWTNVDKNHLQNHKNKAHTEVECEDIRFVSMKDFEINIAHHTVQRGGHDMSKTGKNHGSIVAHNLCPLSDIFKYIPLVMHVIMGLTNDTIKEV